MKMGPVLAVLVLAGYIGFEFWAMSRVAYRMEAPYIVASQVEAQHAMALCGSPDAEQSADFRHNLASVTRRAQRELAETYPQDAAAAIDERIGERTRTSIASVDTLVAEKGCDDIEVWKLHRRYENFARLNLP